MKKIDLSNIAQDMIIRTNEPLQYIIDFHRSILEKKKIDKKPKDVNKKIWLRTLKGVYL